MIPIRLLSLVNGNTCKIKYFISPLLSELRDAVLLVLLDGEFISDLLESLDKMVTAVLIDVFSAFSECFESFGLVNGFRN